MGVSIFNSMYSYFLFSIIFGSCQLLFVFAISPKLCGESLWSSYLRNKITDFLSIFFWITSLEKQVFRILRAMINRHNRSEIFTFTLRINENLSTLEDWLYYWFISNSVLKNEWIITDIVYLTIWKPCISDFS